MLKVLSLFSGIGAFEKALTRLDIDYEVVNYCEIDKYASWAYSVIHNIPEDKNLWDVRKVDTNKLPRDIDLMTWGFPCQDISVAGKQLGINKNTRSGLYYEGLRILKAVKPKYSIIENVKNLTSKKFRNTFNQILNDLDGAGYNNYWEILNAKDYGIPQSRERVFIISIRKDIDDGNFKFPEPFDNGLRLKDLLENEVDEKYYINQEKVEKLIAKDNHRSRTGIIQLGFINKNKQGTGVYDINGMAITLTARCGNLGRTTGLYVVNYRIRRLTPLECWRLMGFDDEDYWKARKALEQRFYKGKDKSDSQMYKMAGNSIVVNVLEEIYKCLFCMGNG